jgi:hypothetical protein
MGQRVSLTMSGGLRRREDEWEQVPIQNRNQNLLVVGRLAYTTAQSPTRLQED